MRLHLTLLVFDVLCYAYDMADASPRWTARRALTLTAWALALRRHITFGWVLYGYFAALAACAPAHLAPTRLPLVFVSFSLLLYSGIYVLNQLFDRRFDRLHETKRLRPIASGQVPTPLARLLFLILTGGGLALGLLLSVRLGIIELVFLLVGVLYSAFLKHVRYLDLVTNTLTHPLRFVLGLVLAGGNPMEHLPAIASVFTYMWIVNVLRRLHELRGGQIDARPVLRQYRPHQLVILAVAGGMAWPVLLTLPSPPLERALIAGCTLVSAALFSGTLWGSSRVRASIRRLADW